MTDMLRAESLGVTLGDREVITDLSLVLQPGWTAIVGPNGAGKSTLLRSLAGLQALHRGRVMLDGKPLTSWSPRGRAKRVAWLGQHAVLDADLTVRETVQLGRLPELGLLGPLTAHDLALVERAMVDAECASWPERRLRALSGGERQRVLLACALAVDAPVLLLDEPTTHLDPPHQVTWMRLLKRLGRERTVVSVLHDITLALQADRLVVMDAGRLVAEGVVDEPAVRQALMATFDHVIRVEQVGGHWMALPTLD